MNDSDLPLAGKRVLILTGEIYEDLELWYPKLRLEEAGAETVVAGPIYEDAEVVVDRHHVSSRRPDDLPAFCRALIAMMS